MNVTGGHNSTNASNQSNEKDGNATPGRPDNAGPPLAKQQLPKRAQELQN